jgi:hypothetical protein
VRVNALCRHALAGKSGRKRQSEHTVANNRNSRGIESTDLARACGTARQRIVSGVPTFISRASLRMSALRIRMHPCEMWPGRSSG